MALQETTTKSNLPVNVTTVVGKQITEYVERGTLQLPPDYSAHNALKQAYLTLSDSGLLDSGKCTPLSIQNALLDMVVQGLNPAKKQCYFIAYGNKLVCQRSYFGDEALALRVQPGIEVYHSVVWEGDEFEWETVRGRKHVTSHKQKLENTGKAIVAAYCGVVSADGEDLGIDLLTMEQIKKSWGQSKTYKPNDADATHNKFPEQMALRTVIRRRLKPIINASSDALLLESISRQEEEIIEGEMNEEVAANANQQVLSLESGTAPEQTVKVEPETKAAPVVSDDVEPSEGPGY